MAIEDAFDLSSFSGLLPLFPLEHNVLFPGMLQPVKLHTAGMQKMVDIAREGERFLGLVLYKPEGQPLLDRPRPLYRTACMGRILADEEDDDGVNNVVLLGVCRATILQEVKQEPFRVGEVELLLDDSDEVTDDIQAMHRHFLDVCQTYAPQLAEQIENVQNENNVVIPLGALLDSLAAAFDFDEHEKQLILEEADLIRRGCKLHRLLEHLVGGENGDISFPPLPTDPGPDVPLN